MLKFENVSKAFSPKSSALTDISFTIEDGEFVFLVGASGAGKSTLLTLINCQLWANHGDITFNDYYYPSLRRKDIPEVRRTIGSIFQDYKLLLDRTVEENVRLPLEIVGVKKPEINEFVTQALNEVGLDGKQKVFPRELAGGEVQRVAIARAIITNPALLLADEPTADLDEDNAWIIVRLLEKINQVNNTTVIMATHNKDIVDKMKKRVITIENGMIVSDTGKHKKSTEVHAEAAEETKDEDKKKKDEKIEEQHEEISVEVQEEKESKKE